MDMLEIEKLRVSLFADGANLDEIKNQKMNPLVKGFTTNPTLMRSAGVTNFLEFAKQASEISFPLPISFEVIADSLDEMERQAIILSNLAPNIFVKIPVTNTQGVSTNTLIRKLNSLGIKLNITAIFTLLQVMELVECLKNPIPSVVSIFAGRIADSGIDPMPLMKSARELVGNREHIKILWASPRELLNIIQAEDANCDIITMTQDLWKKIGSLGKNLEEFSLETVQMFYRDALSSKYEL